VRSPVAGKRRLEVAAIRPCSTRAGPHRHAPRAANIGGGESGQLAIGLGSSGGTGVD